MKALTVSPELFPGLDTQDCRTIEGGSILPGYYASIEITNFAIMVKTSPAEYLGKIFILWPVIE